MGFLAKARKALLVAAVVFVPGSIPALLLYKLLRKKDKDHADARAFFEKLKKELES